ncbi:PQ-loop repeat-containing protein 3 [Amphibalanus amphitrite]|uniref:PQ-loop repeat-containing protein 3 n=1 Tax=Amphibalanus amphitrite TaxID=1232801 RepID=A0A6A4W3P5_AMPAM|nr:PQ-loop repeat-containing protein 3 [Amphibalanus amphitrite]
MDACCLHCLLCSAQRLSSTLHARTICRRGWALGHEASRSPSQDSCTGLSASQGCAGSPPPAASAAVSVYDTAHGLSLQSLLLECTAFTVNFCYNAGHGYPLDSYFEYALLIPQDVLADPVAAGLASGAAPLSALKLLLSCALPIGFSSKIVQLRAILGSKDARADTTLLTSFSVNLVLNSLVAMAAFTYRHGPATKLDGVKKTE